MKMVASSKLHHAQVAIQNMLHYETMLEHILNSYLSVVQLAGCHHLHRGSNLARGVDGGNAAFDLF